MFLLWLVLSEIMYYREGRVFNKFVPDVDFNDTLTIVLDMTVALPCDGMSTFSTLSVSVRADSLFFYLRSQRSEPTWLT